MTATTTAGAPRPPQLAATKAAHQLGIGRPCPVCGATLTAASADSRDGLWLGESVLRMAGLAAGGVLGFNFALRALGRQTSCACDRCQSSFRGIPVFATKVAALLVILGGGGLVGLFGLKAISSAAGGKLILSVLAILVACVSPIYAYFTLTHPWKTLAERIARARARWQEEQKAGPIEIDTDALLKASTPGAACPVCEKGRLQGAASNPLWTRGTLGCPGCRVEIPMALTPLGSLVGTVLAGVLIVAAAYTIWVARGFTGTPFVTRGGIGILLGLAGMYVGFMVNGAGDESAKNELERARRVFVRRTKGLPVRSDEDEEPVVWLQENLEAVVVAFILALVIRHFVMEAFVIPTGSMAPTLLGDHFRVECRHCHYRFAVSKSGEGSVQPNETVSARCPLCGVGAPTNSIPVTDRDAAGGNKILVNKFIYKFEKPERFQVVVFKFPKNPTRNFIKRLIGLPGEYIKIDSRGDIWARREGETSHLVHKPATVQEELWFPVYDARYPDPRESAWRPEDPARWEAQKGSGDSEAWVAKPGSNDQWLNYGREIRDYYGYNKDWGSSAKPVGDVRVRARVTPATGSKSVKLAVVENERAILADIPVGSGEKATIGTFTHDGVKVAAEGKVPALTPGTAANVALGYADERVTLTVNGETVIEWDDPLSPASTTTSSVRLGADPAGARFEDVKVDRDIFYVPAHGSHPEFDPSNNEVHVPNDCYFMMGDNSPNSQDGREWGFVHEPHLIGRAFLVFWPLEDVKLIR